MTEQLFLHFLNTNKQYQVTSQEAVIAGRANICNLQLGEYLNGPVTTISSRHFKIFHSANRGFLIADLYSTNGTQLNGETLPPEEPRLLRNKDLVRLSKNNNYLIEIRTDHGDGFGEDVTDAITQALIRKEEAKALAKASNTTNKMSRPDIIDEPSGLFFNKPHFFIDEKKIPQTHLTETEYNLLKYLYDHSERVCSYSELSDHVWGWAEKSAIAQAIKKLRQKLDAIVPDAGRYHIQTKRGRGYLCTRKRSE